MTNKKKNLKDPIKINVNKGAEWLLVDLNNDEVFNYTFNKKMVINLSERCSELAKGGFTNFTLYIEKRIISAVNGVVISNNIID